MFDLDQGFVNGPVQNGDIAALKNVVQTLTAFQNRFETYVVLRADTEDAAKATAVLDFLTASKVPFFLDVYSSDVLGVHLGMAAYDRTHGRALSISQLKAFKARYPESFMGIRIFEVFAQNYTALACQRIPADKGWCAKWQEVMPKYPDRFYQDRYIGEFMDWASSYYSPSSGPGMAVFYSDFYWSVYNDSWFANGKEVNQPGNEQELKAELAKHKNNVYVAFANNAAGQAAAKKLTTYQHDLAPFQKAGAIAIGVSDQAWFCSPVMTCPSNTLIDWANTILDSHDPIKIVETEPYWFWWNFPIGSGSKNNYKLDPANGMATDKLRALAKAYGVVLP